MSDETKTDQVYQRELERLEAYEAQKRDIYANSNRDREELAKEVGMLLLDSEIKEEAERRADIARKEAKSIQDNDLDGLLDDLERDTNLDRDV